jgi:hypothetical protein
VPSTLGIVASAIFTPLDLPGLVGWWDADDASTFTYSSGTFISQWDDKSGKGYHLVQSTGANQPDRSGTINGRSSVVFDGSNDSFSVTNFDMTGGQQFSVAAVFTAASGSDRVIAEHTADLNNTSGAWLFFRVGNNTVELAKRGQTALLYAAFATTGTVTTAAKTFVGTHDGTLSTNETSGWLDGSGAGSPVINANTNANNVSATLFVGARGGTSLFLNGQIAELIITTSVLTTGERETLQTYLKDKWGTA